MVVLGIILIVLAVFLGLGVAVSSTNSTMLEVYGVNFGVMVPTVFFLGAAVGAVLIIGLWVAKKGVRRGYRKRKEVKELRQQAQAAPAPSQTSPALSSTAADAPERRDERLATEPHTVADGTDTSSAQRER